MGTWQIVRSSWKVAFSSLSVIGVLAVIFVIFNSIELLLKLQQAIAPSGLPIAVFWLAWCLAFPFIQGGCLSLASAKLSSPPASSSLASFWNGGRQLYGRLLGCFIFLLGMMVLWGGVNGLTFNIVAIADSGTVPVIAAAATLILTAIFGIWLYVLLVIFMMAPVAIVVENVRVVTGIRRGLQVGRVALGKLVSVHVALILTVLPMTIFWTPHLLWSLGATVMQGWLMLGVLLQGMAQGLGSVLFAAAVVQIYQRFAGSIPGRVLPTAEEAAEAKKRVVRRLFLWPVIILGLIVAVPAAIFLIVLLFGIRQ